MAESRALLRVVRSPRAADPVDFGRGWQYTKRRGDAPHLTFTSNDDHWSMMEPGRDVVALDGALSALARIGRQPGTEMALCRYRRD